MTATDARDSVQSIRRGNAAAVLRAAWDAEVVTAADLMESTGLTRATVLSLCNELVRLGWLRELDDSRQAGQHSKGRPARRQSLDTRAGYLVGIDADRDQVSACVADLRGRVRSEVARAVNDSDSPSTRLSAVQDALDSACARAGLSPDEVLVVVVGVPAPTDAHGSSPPSEDHFWERMNPGYAVELAREGRTVLVENDANLSAIAERDLGAGQGCTSFATLLAGDRFGAGLVVDGILLRGSHGRAGELQLLDLVEGVGSTDGLDAIARRWVNETSATRAAAGAEVTPPLVEALADRLARVCVIIAGLLDVERIILAGSLVTRPEILEHTAEALRRHPDTLTPELLPSRLGSQGIQLGAVQRGMEIVRSDPLSFTTRTPAVKQFGRLG